MQFQILTLWYCHIAPRGERKIGLTILQFKMLKGKGTEKFYKGNHETSNVLHAQFFVDYNQHSILNLDLCSLSEISYCSTILSIPVSMFVMHPFKAALLVAFHKQYFYI